MTHFLFGLYYVSLTVLLLLASCDNSKRSFTGDYSYKLSGEIKLTDTDGETSYRLLHRNGQMNILRDKSDRHRYIITMNEMNAQAVHGYGEESMTSR